MNHSDRTWIRKEVSTITGLSDRRILFYTDQDMLPNVDKSVGRGVPRLYNLMAVFFLLIIRELDRLGFSLNYIRVIISFIWSAQLKSSGDTNSPPPVELIKEGSFTDKVHVLVISYHPTELVSPAGAPVREEIDMKWYVGEKGAERINIQADTSSQVVLNLNEIFKKGNW